MQFYYSDKIKLEIVDALSGLKGKARFNQIRTQINEARKSRHDEIPIKRFEPKKISTSTLAIKLEELEKGGKIDVVRLSKNKVIYMLPSTRLSDSEYILGDVIVSLADILRLLGVSSALTTAIRAVQEMKPKEFELVVKGVEKIERRIAKARSHIERYLQYQP